MADTSKPLVDPSYVSEVFDELSTMVVDLDEDPLEYSPARLNEKIKRCRDHLGIIETRALEASRKLLKIKEEYRRAFKLYEIEERKLLNKDPEVRAGRSFDDRRAIARGKLETEVDELTWLEQGIEDMEAVIQALKHKQAGLKNTQAQIKEQRNLCNEGLTLGRTWLHKDKKDPKLVPKQGRSVSAVAAETEDLIESMGATADAQNDEDTEAEVDDDEDEDTEAQDEETETGVENVSDDSETDVGDLMSDLGLEDDEPVEPETKPEPETETTEPAPLSDLPEPDGESPELRAVEDANDPTEEVEITEDDADSFLDQFSEGESKDGSDDDAPMLGSDDLDALIDGLG